VTWCPHQHPIEPAQVASSNGSNTDDVLVRRAPEEGVIVVIVVMVACIFANVVIQEQTQPITTQQPIRFMSYFIYEPYCDHRS
jgi:hypothetical protein